jgi:uncharacterized phiE125 gp8 family phage protein
MPLQIVTPPALEPVTLDEAKAHLRVGTADEDALIATLITAARARAEWHLGRALVAQGWIQWLDNWCAVVELALPPLIAVTAVTLYARDGSETVIDPSRYFVDTASAPGRIAFDCAAPGDLRRRNAVAIAFDAGYGEAADDVPAPIREAILRIVADLHVNRGDGGESVPQSALSLLAPYRMFKL